ncbi:hypothetical protein F4861DRAFT_534809 [Xylaria intraflava]|nr:hypothetical protein F4861DRAFT_534809 [Xylaria intraflava]
MLRLFEHFKVGNTVAVLFPASRQLVDGSIAVDIHYTDTVLIMPLKLEEALAMNRLAIEFVNRDGTPRKCHACGKVKENLSQCGRCVLFGYCDRECQVKAWDDHKKFCKVLKDVNVRSLMLMDFNQTWDSILAFE